MFMVIHVLFVFFNFSRFWVVGGVEDDRQSLTSEQSSRAIKQSQRSSVSNKPCKVIIIGQMSVTDTFLYTKNRLTTLRVEACLG